MYNSARSMARIAVVLALTLSPAGVWALYPGAPVVRPIVVRAAVDLLEPDRLVIRGKHFGVKTAPTVWLARVKLEVLAFSDEQIVARLPLDAPTASYRLQVFAGGTVPSPVVEVTVERTVPSAT